MMVSLPTAVLGLAVAWLPVFSCPLVGLASPRCVLEIVLIECSASLPPQHARDYRLPSPNRLHTDDCGYIVLLQRQAVPFLFFSGQACPEVHQERRCFIASCASDCIVSEWGEWSPCGASCGGGQQARQRSVLSVPVEGGEECPALIESRACNTFSCDGGCDVGPWGEWGPCSKPCEGGTKTRTRAVEPLEDGADCPPSTQTAPCNLHDCGEYPSRSFQSFLPSLRPFFSCCWALRLLFSPASPLFSSHRESGANFVTGRLRTRRSAFAFLCLPPLSAVDCVASEWGSWSGCNVPCGVGTQRRIRDVIRAPKGAGDVCPPLDQLKPCDRGPCRADCVLSEWSAWGECSHPCGLGEQRRTRQVLGAPTDRGNPCGALEETRPCGGHCDPKCILSDWTEWAQCTSLCQQVSRVGHTLKES